MFIVTVLCPILGGLFVGLCRMRSSRMRGGLAVALMLLTSFLVSMLVRRGLPDCVVLSYAEHFTLAFGMDRRSQGFLILMAVLWPLSMLYALEYMHHEAREATFFMWYLIAYGVMILFCCAQNLFTLYVLYECVTLSTLPLVWHTKDPLSIAAARSYVRYSIGCAAFGFVTVVILGTHDSLAFVPGGHMYASLSDRVLQSTFVLAFLGFGVKAAIFPFSRWLPKASAAPTPVTALLHAVAVVNAGVFSVQRVIYDVFGTDRLRGGWGQNIALTFAALTIVFGAVMAVREHHVKRRLAYSTVSNLGYMLLGAALMTVHGDASASLHMVAHSLTKIVLFFCAGAVLVQTGRTHVADMRGLGRRMPWTFVTFFLCALSLMGIPPLAGFSSKYALILAAIESGGAWAVLGPAALLLSAILTAVYTMTVAVPAWFVAPVDPVDAAQDPSWKMVLPMTVITGLMVAAGLCPDVLMNALIAG